MRLKESFQEGNIYLYRIQNDLSSIVDNELGTQVNRIFCNNQSLNIHK